MSKKSIPIQDENVFNDATGLKWASSQGDLNTSIMKIVYTYTENAKLYL